MIQHNLSNLSKNELLDLWRKLPTRDKAPSATKVLIRELAYRLQEQTSGKLDKNTTVSLRRHMATIAQSLANGKNPNLSKPPQKTFLQAGSEIRKQWQGKEIIIQVQGKRLFQYNGKNFKSLSAIAKAITGQHLSGPLFFNLK